MSNARKPQGKPNSLDRYRAQVAKDTKGPFVFWIDDERKLEIPRPDGKTIFDVEGATSSREVIELLAGDQADELLAIFEAEDFGVMRAVSEDMKAHFGLEEQ